MSSEKIIRIVCPRLSCGRVLCVPERARGKLVRCKGCGMVVRIPQRREAPAAAAPKDDAAQAKPEAEPAAKKR